MGGHHSHEVAQAAVAAEGEGGRPSRSGSEDAGEGAGAAPPPSLVPVEKLMKVPTNKATLLAPTRPRPMRGHLCCSLST